MQLELGDRRQAVEKLRAKYETLAKGFAGAGAGAGEGGGGGAGGSSQAFFIIAAAQKREELQREGDELDQEIRRCEREIRALESTLRHLNARNVDFRVSFQRADPASRDADALRSLEARAKTAQDKLFRRKKELQRAQTDHEEDLARLDGAKARATRLDEQNAQLGAVQVQAEAHLQAQQETLGKAEVRLKKYRASHRKITIGGGGVTDTIFSAGNTPAPVAGGTTTATASENAGETLTEKALRASTIRDTASGVLYTLGQLAKEFPEMHDPLQTGLRTRRLKIPPAPPSHGPASGGGVSSRRGNGKTQGSGSAGGSRSGSEHSYKGGLSARSSRSGGDGRGGSLWDRQGSRSNAANDGISPMRVFEAPL